MTGYRDAGIMILLKQQDPPTKRYKMYTYTSNNRISHTKTYSIVNQFIEDAQFVYCDSIRLCASREIALNRVAQLYGPSVTAVVEANNK